MGAFLFQEVLDTSLVVSQTEYAADRLIEGQLESQTYSRMWGVSSTNYSLARSIQHIWFIPFASGAHTLFFKEAVKLNILRKLLLMLECIEGSL